MPCQMVDGTLVQALKQRNINGFMLLPRDLKGRGLIEEMGQESGFRIIKE